MVYLGIDLHRKRSHVVAVQQDGEQLLSRRVETRPDSLWHLFGEFDDQPIQVAFESTFGWGWLADLLADAGIPAHMAHPWPPRPSPARGSRTTRSMPTPSPSCSAATSCPRPGSPRPSVG